MARIQRFSSRVDAEVAASMLTARGIEARVVNDDTGGMHPNLAFGHGGSEIVVPDDQLEEATALLDDGSVAAHARTTPPDEGTPQLTVGQLWRRGGAVLLVALLVLVALSSELDIRWF
ncbi:MAG: DUF2007 domain-containing protein [Nitriliruptoraceae bacterium]